MAREQESKRMLVEERVLIQDLQLPGVMVNAGTELTTFEKDNGQYVVIHFTGWWDVDKEYFEVRPDGIK